MKWVKKGLIFCPDGGWGQINSHASNPVAEPIGDGLFRVYFSGRDKENRSSIYYFEFDVGRPEKVLRFSSEPVVGPGEPGLFDDSGASMGCLVRVEDRRYLYYVGWNLGVTVPWRNSIGLAIGRADEPVFEKYSKVPIVDRSDVDPFSLSYPMVMREGAAWKMWYGSNLGWGPCRADMRHVIKYAESADGIHWKTQGLVAISLKPDEQAVARPWVLKEGQSYKMWYSCQEKSYRLGYAESADGVHWERMDEEVGIDISESGWDSEMIEYPSVFDHEGRRYMLYNGNGYGKTGIGLAVLERS
jgi:hypothetical protein